MKLAIKIKAILLLFWLINASILAENHKTDCTFHDQDGDEIPMTMDVSIDGKKQVISFTDPIPSGSINFTSSEVITQYNEEQHASHYRIQNFSSGQSFTGYDLISYLVSALHFFRSSPPSSGNAGPVPFSVPSEFIISLVPVEVLVNFPEDLLPLEAEEISSIGENIVYTNLMVQKHMFIRH